MAEILSVHTMQVWRTISQYEAKEVCERYKDIIEEKIDDKGNKHMVINNPGIKGVNQITISIYPRKDMAKDNIQISLVLNIGKMIGKSRVAMTELRKKNVENFIEAINKVLDDKLHLHPCIL